MTNTTFAGFDRQARAKVRAPVTAVETADGLRFGVPESTVEMKLLPGLDGGRIVITTSARPRLSPVVSARTAPRQQAPTAFPASHHRLGERPSRLARREGAVMDSTSHDRSHPSPTAARAGGDALAGSTALAIPAASRPSSLRGPLVWGVVVGVVQAAAPVAFPWLPAATVYALSLPLIAAVYIGFAVADGRTHVLVVETVVASAFVVVAAVSVTGSAWLIVVGLAGHGLKDFWQHRTQFVTNTRWWPPFCAGVDFVAAALIAVIITTDFSFPW